MNALPLWFQVAITILPILLPPLISLSTVLYQHLLQRMPQQKQELVEGIVRIVVPAVEQTTTGLMNSTAKKQEAMDMATKMMDALHIRVSEDMLSSMIEATVFALNQSKGAPTVITQPSPLAEAKAS